MNASLRRTALPPSVRRRSAAWRRALVLAAVVASVAHTGVSFAEPPAPEPPQLPLTQPSQSVDWALRRVEVEGMALAPPSWDGAAARRLASEKMARADVARRLLAQVGDLQVTGEGVAGQAGARMASDPALHRAIVQRLNQTEEMAVRFFSDGGVSLRAALSLEAVSDLLLHGVRSPPAPRPAPAPDSAPSGAYTGLVVDAQSLVFSPRLRLVLADSGGRVLFDATLITRQASLPEGPAAWVRQTSQALRQARVGMRPLWLRAVGVGPDPDTLTVAELSGVELAALAPHLAQGRLVVVW